MPSASQYRAPIFFAGKKGGADLRVYTDCSNLNSYTVTYSFLLPRIDDLLLRQCGSKVFSKLDLRYGYHKIPVAYDDR